MCIRDRLVPATINPSLKYDIKVFDLIISGLYGKFCKISDISEEDVSSGEDLIKKNVSV